MILPGHPGRYSPRRRRLDYRLRRAAWAVAAALALGLLMLADRAGCFGRAPTPDWDKYQGKSFPVVKVVDGDTLDVGCPDGRHRTTRVRLLGVDTPESVKPDTPVQHFGLESAAYLRDAALGRSVTLELDRARTRDQFGRLLAYVLLPGGENVNLRIVATGHGYADPRFRHPLEAEFKRTQTRARKARVGLWRDATDADLPYYYRGKLKLPAAPTTAP